MSAITSEKVYFCEGPRERECIDRDDLRVSGFLEFSLRLCNCFVVGVFEYIPETEKFHSLLVSNIILFLVRAALRALALANYRIMYVIKKLKISLTPYYTGIFRKCSNIFLSTEY